MTLTLPWPPSVNHYWARNRNGGLRVGERGVAYRWAVKIALRGTSRLEGRLEMTARLHPPDRIRRDIDNPLKALLDSLTHAGVYGDDSQIKRLTVELCEPRKGGAVEVTLAPYAGSEAA